MLFKKACEENKGITFVKSKEKEKYVSYKELLMTSSKILGFCKVKELLIRMR